MIAKTTVTVRKPVATITAITQNVVKVDFNYPNNGYPVLHFGELNGNPGIKFSRTPDAVVQWDWLQRINSSRQHRYPTLGVWTNWIGNGLDTGFPYGPEQNYSVNDNPAEEVSAGADQVRVQDAFEMYLMYKPSGSAAIYVPITYVEWSWAGQADLTNNVWVLSSSPAAGVISPPNGDTEPPYPAWTNKFQFAPVSAPISP
jgi:hypothetical protein